MKGKEEKEKEEGRLENSLIKKTPHNVPASKRGRPFEFKKSAIYEVAPYTPD